MKRYSILIEKSAHKSLRKIVPPFQNRIVEAISGLAENPRPPGVKKLTGREAWRIRVGDYRIIYEIHDDQFVILIIIIGNRRDVYQ